MQRQMDAAGLECQFIEAVDCFDNFGTGNDPVLTETIPATVACKMSHIKALDYVIKNNTPMACILEDDAVFLSTFVEVSNSLVLQKTDWELLLLSHYSEVIGGIYYMVVQDYNLSVWHAAKHGALYKFGKKRISRNHFIAKRVKTLATPLSAAGYLVTLSGAKKLKQIATDSRGEAVHQPYDHITGSADSFGIAQYLITPPCVRLHKGYLAHSATNRNRDENYAAEQQADTMQGIKKYIWPSIKFIWQRKHKILRTPGSVFYVFIFVFRDIVLPKLKRQFSSSKQCIDAS